MLKRMMLMALSTNLMFAAAQKPVVMGPPNELEEARSLIEKLQKLVADTWSDITNLKPDETFFDKQLAINRNLFMADLDINEAAWLPSENESRKAWNSLQGMMRTYNIMPSETYRFPNIWDAWSAHDWKNKEEIISSDKPGQGTIWKINPGLGDFMQLYMTDYTKLGSGKTSELTRLVGDMVPSVFGHGISKSQQTLKATIQKIAKIAPNTGKALEEQFKKRFGGAAQVAQARVATPATPAKSTPAVPGRPSVPAKK